MPFRVFLAALVFVITAAQAQTNDGYVGVYEDSLGLQPCAAIVPYHGGTLYVLGQLAGATAGGITGAEFRIEFSNSAGWLLNYTAPPGAIIAIGSPIDTQPAVLDDGSGVNLSFASCRQPSASGIVRLGTISAFNLSGGPSDLVVKRHSRPSNPTTQCPSVPTWMRHRSPRSLVQRASEEIS